VPIAGGTKDNFGGVQKIILEEDAKVVMEAIG
jgi:hypothetical protein